MIKFPTIRTVEDLEAFEQSFAVSFDLMELRAAIFHISDAYRYQGDRLEDLAAKPEALSDLRHAVETFVHAYRQRYSKSATGGVRADAPMRAEVAELNAALAAASPAERPPQIPG